MGKHLVFMYVKRERLAEIQLIFFEGKGISNHTDSYHTVFSKTAILENRTLRNLPWEYVGEWVETIALQYLWQKPPPKKITLCGSFIKPQAPLVCLLQ